MCPLHTNYIHIYAVLRTIRAEIREFNQRIITSAYYSSKLSYTQYTYVCMSILHILHTHIYAVRRTIRAENDTIYEILDPTKLRSISLYSITIHSNIIKQQ